MRFFILIDILEGFLENLDLNVDVPPDHRGGSDRDLRLLLQF